jgi:hypothetical protein
MYYPQHIENRVGSVLPKFLLDTDYVNKEPVNNLWKEVSEKGYAILDNLNIPKELDNSITNESFIPFGLNPLYSLSETIHFPFFISKANYNDVEEHDYPKYLNDIIETCFKSIPNGTSLINNYKLGTPDLTKYVYLEKETSNKGPYSFHSDYKKRLLYMFFLYFPKDNEIEGRELIIGKNCNLKDIKKPSEPVSEEDVEVIDRIKIKRNKAIVVNTLNPYFLHKVIKLKKKNEVIFLNTNVWCEKFS